MSKKSKRKIDIKSSILVLFLVAILLTASTYAWFTTNTTVTISSLDVNVAVASGLQISADGTTWKTVLNTSDITPGQGTLNTNYGSNTNQIPTILTPVSSAGVLDAGKMQMFLGEVTSNDDTGAYELTAEVSPEQRGSGDNAGHFIAFDVFLRVDAPDTLVYLTAGSDVTSIGTNGDKGLKNAARVAFCLSPVIAVGSSITGIQNLVPNETPVIWEPNYDVHTTAGVANAHDNYSKTTSVGPGAAAVEYFGINEVINTAVPLDSEGDSLTRMTNLIQTPAADDPTSPTNRSNVEVFTLQAGITKVRIYMWVEGQDVDCENTASGSDIRFDVGFTLEAPTP